jgi:methionyl-tRNA formyltransferase
MLTEKTQKKIISKQPENLFNLYRGLYQWPGIWTKLPNGKRLKITKMELIDGQLNILKVQLEGKNEVDSETFTKAYNVSF